MQTMLPAAEPRLAGGGCIRFANRVVADPPSRKARLKSADGTTTPLTARRDHLGSTVSLPSSCSKVYAGR
jgi:hypothetical protein